jgi:hypothetical protein
VKGIQAASQCFYRIAVVLKIINPLLSQFPADAEEAVAIASQPLSGVCVMCQRILMAGLIFLAVGTGAQADAYRDQDHRFEANFPGKVKRVTLPIDGGKMVIAVSQNDTHLFMLGAVVLTQELNPDDVTEFAKGFVGAFMEKRKNASITKEEELKLSDNTPVGTGFVVKHDAGWFFAWVTIENGKAYCVTVEAKSEESLKADAVKNFQKSVKIKAGAE